MANRLSIHPVKTEAVLFGTHQKTSKVDKNAANKVYKSTILPILDYCDVQGRRNWGGGGRRGGRPLPFARRGKGDRSALWVLKYTWQILRKLFHMV